MSEPLVWISRYQANPAMLDEYKEFAQRLVDRVAEEEPDMVYFNYFLDEETNEVTVVQLHRTAENMAVHMGVIGPLMAEARDKNYFDMATLKAQVLGAPTEELRSQMEQMAGAGEVTHSPAMTQRSLDT